MWQQGINLAVEIYRATEGFPKHETYGLTSQVRRAAVSVPSNVAEGKGRHTDRDFAHFLYHARGSLLEVETQVQLAERLGYLSAARSTALLKDTAAVGSALV